MKKKTKLFKHFITILNILACSVPLIAFAIVTLQDVLPKYFTSLGMQHHGDGSSTFDDDLNALTDSNQFKDMNYHMLNTLDRLDYFNYDITGRSIVEVPTNDISSPSDFVIGNFYHIDIRNHTIDEVFAYEDGLFFSMLFYNVSYFNLGGNGFNFDDTDSSSDYSDGDITFVFNVDCGSGEYNVSFGFYSGDIELYSVFYVYFVSDTFDEFPFYLTGDFRLIDMVSVRGVSSSMFSRSDYAYIEQVEGYDNFDDFIDYQNNRSYTDIIQDTDTHLPLNIDFISLFTQSEIVNRNGNVAIYLFINYYMNYLINILIILFLPELTIIFFFMLKNLTYKLIDKEI